MPLAREFVWGNPDRYPEVVAMIRHNPDTQDQWTYHYLHDVLGSVIGLVDAAGELVERYTYDPYGKVFIETWDDDANEGAGDWVASAEPTSGMPHSAVGNPWMWTGQRYDASTGTYGFHARTYGPEIGRFLQRDPLEYEAGSVNLYEYVLSAPLFWKDPLGLDRYLRRPFFEQHTYLGFDEYDKDGNKTGNIKWYDFAPPSWSGRGGKKTGGMSKVIKSPLVPVKGQIFGPDVQPAGDEDCTKKSTREHDEATQELIEQEQKNPPDFDLGDKNCIGWASCYYNDPSPEEKEAAKQEELERNLRILKSLGHVSH